MGRTGPFPFTGDGTFSAAATLNLPGGSGPNASPVLIDLNGDSKLDVLQPNYWGNSISVRLGNGDGTFSAAATLNFGVDTRPTTPRVVDLNGDSKLDLIQTNFVGNSVSVRLGNGDGSFSAAATIALPAFSYPESAPTVVDLNGDSKLDFVLAATNNNSISVRLGNGDGTFSAAATISLPAGSQPSVSPILADLNGDNELDIVAVNRDGDSISIRLGNVFGKGSFSAAATINLPSGATPNTAPAVVDLNGDSKLDIVLTSRDGDAISIRLGNGDGSFSAAATINLPPGTYAYSSPVVEDLNGDSVPDIVQAAYINAISILLGTTEESSSSEDAGDLTVDDLSIATQEAAENSLSLIDSALAVLASARANIGAVQNRLESAASVSASAIESLSSARSQLVDSDVAEETAEFTRSQILQQGSVAVLSSANLSQQLALQLLKF